MLLRDLRDAMSKLRGARPLILASAAETLGDDALRVRGRKHDFSPPIILEDEIGGVAVWAQEGFGDGSFINGYDEAGNRTHHAPLAGLGAGTSSLHFVEGDDGFHYGVFSDGTNYKLLKRFKVNETSITDVSTLATLADEIDYFHGHNPVMVGPDGSVYLRVRDVPDFNTTGGLDQPWGKKYQKWDGASLTDVGGVDVAWTSHGKFENRSCGSVTGCHAFCIDSGTGECADNDLYLSFTYRANVIVLDIYRHWAPLILLDGRWVVADTIPGDATISTIGFEGSVAAADCQHMALHCNCTPGAGNCNPYPVDNICHQCWPGPDFQVTTWRMKGNAWWERPDDVSAFSAVAGGGETTQASSRAMDTFGAATCPPNQLIVFMNNGMALAGETQMPWEAARVAHVVVERLPTLRFRQDFGSVNCAGSTDPNTPWQGDPIMDADDVDIYYFLVGGNDVNNAFQAGSVYKAAIPGAGNLPSFSPLGIAQQVDGTLTGMALSTRKIWVAYGENVSVNGLRYYNKDGGGENVLLVAAGIFSVTTAWAHRWKHE